MEDRQKIRFCTSADGVQIAYATSGQGQPLVKAANYLTHLEHDWKSPVWQHWWRGLGRNHTLIRYDERGCGLSDWDIGEGEFSLDAWVQDLEAVVEAVGLERFVLLGISQGASVSVAFAVKHPEMVSHLILYGGYARGRFHRDVSLEQMVEAETLLNAIRVGWGQDNPAFRQLFTTLLIPEGTDEQEKWLNELQRISTSPENAAVMEKAFYGIDVTELARKVSISTLVLHSRQDATIPFEEGRLLATLIPDARFVPLNSKNHILLEDEPAWEQFLTELHNFIGTEVTIDHTDSIFNDLTNREREVLNMIAQGLGNEQIADRLVISSKTVRNHISNIYSKLDVKHRGEAVVRAREAGFGQNHANPK